MSTKTIKDLELGQYVHGSEGYAVVRGCVHGKKYYGYAEDDHCTADGCWVEAVEVVDMDEDYVSACCG